MCKSVNMQNFTHLHTCITCAMCVQVLQLEFSCNYVCKICAICMQVLELEFVCNCAKKGGCMKFCTFIHMQNMCTCKMCEMCKQVLQLKFVCNYVCISADVQNFAHSHTCKMCAFFITALLPTVKIQESQFAFAYLPKYKITKTALKEIVDSNSFD